MPVQLKEILHQHGHTVKELYDAMYLRGCNITYKEVTRYGRCHERDSKPRWDQIEACLEEAFGIKLPW
jgi:hypothetical protein